MTTTTNTPPGVQWSVPYKGETIDGKYVVGGPCGRGGLAAVVSAMHIHLNQRVAIKVLLPEWAGDTEVVERFLREGRAATSIRSEHVVRVFDVGTLPTGAPYLVLEYLEGHNLDEVLVTWGPPPVATAVDWVLQASEAIAEAHSRGIVHRDLKPANLFLVREADGSACIKVIDFGLSKIIDPKVRSFGPKLTQPNEVFGSPHYMAPEQLRATGDADIPADLWSLGAVMHELLTGKPPFNGETTPEVCAAVLTESPAPLTTLREDVPSELEAVVLRCLQKDPSNRFASVSELARALAPYGSHAGQESYARIERIIEGAARPSNPGDPSFPPLLLDPPWPEPGETGRRSFLVGSERRRWPRTLVRGALAVAGIVAAAVLGMTSMDRGGSRRNPWADLQNIVAAQISFDARQAERNAAALVPAPAMPPVTTELPKEDPPTRSPDAPSAQGSADPRLPAMEAPPSPSLPRAATGTSVNERPFIRPAFVAHMSTSSARGAPRSSPISSPSHPPAPAPLQIVSFRDASSSEAMPTPTKEATPIPSAAPVTQATISVPAASTDVFEGRK